MVFHRAACNRTHFNIYTSDTPIPQAQVKLTTYALHPTTQTQLKQTSNHTYMKYIHGLGQTTSSSTQTTQHALSSHRTQQNTAHNLLQIDNITLPMNINPKILGLTLDPKLTYNKHIEITTTKARKTIQILKALTSTTWGKQKETIIALYKAITIPILQYVSTIWSPLASDTNINKLQIPQNTALRIATGCTTDTNTQHLHDETHTLPIREHLQLHASQIRQKSQHPTHPLHYITTQHPDVRNKQHTATQTLTQTPTPQTMLKLRET